MYWCRVHKVRVASFVSSMFACKQGKKRYKTYERRREKAYFAVCEQQISQTSLRVRADYTGCPPSLIYCSLIQKHEICAISLFKDRIFTCRLLHLSFPFRPC